MRHLGQILNLGIRSLCLYELYAMLAINPIVVTLARVGDYLAIVCAKAPAEVRWIVLIFVDFKLCHQMSPPFLLLGRVPITLRRSMGPRSGASYKPPAYLAAYFFAYAGELTFGTGDFSQASTPRTNRAVSATRVPVGGTVSGCNPKKDHDD